MRSKYLILHGFCLRKKFWDHPPALFKESPNVLTFRCGLLCSYLLEEFCPQMTYRKRELVPSDMLDATLSQISRLLVSSMLILSTYLRLEVNWHPSWTYVKNAEKSVALWSENLYNLLCSTECCNHSPDSYDMVSRRLKYVSMHSYRTEDKGQWKGNKKCNVL